MAETGDLIKEFKGAKPSEKVVIVVGVLAVGGIAFYLYKKNSGGSSPFTAGTPASPGTQQAGYPSVGANGTPVLPNGVNPIYDPNGNLVAFQNPPPASPPTPSAPTPAKWYTNLLGAIPYGAKINPGGIDANGQRFWYGTNSFFYAPVGTSFAPGGAGRIWLNLPNKPSNQQGILITGPGMQPSKTVVAKTASQVTH